MKSKLRYYLFSILFILAAGAFLSNANWGEVIGNPLPFAFFLILFLGSTFLHIDIGKNSLLTLNDAVGFAAILSFGPTFGAGVFGIGMVFHIIWDRKAIFRRIVFLSIGITEFFVAGMIYFGVFGGSHGISDGALDVAYALIAGFSLWLIDRISAFALLEAAGLQTVPQFFQRLKPFAVSLPPLYIWGMGLAFVFTNSGYVFTLALTVPLLLVYAYFRSQKAYQDSLQDTVFSLTKTIDARDEYTGRHSESVARNAGLIARRIGFSEEEAAGLYEISLLHDIGKVGIRDNILLKHGKLDDDEWKIMRTHPIIGADLVGELRFLAGSADAIRHHHERWDGGGYPDGLRGEEIPLWARIIALCDAWDAMRTDRPYRKALSVEIALSEIENGSGKQFDPELVPFALEVFRAESDVVDEE